MASVQPHERATVQRTSTATLSPSKVLVVIDGSERTGRVIEHALRLAQGERCVEVVLLGLVPEPPEDRLRSLGSFKRSEIHARLKEVIGQRAVGAAARRFDQAGVSHKQHVEVGDPVETILRVASQQGCDVILLGDAPAGAVQRWLPKVIGLSVATVASQVVQLAPIPVVVVK